MSKTFQQLQTHLAKHSYLTAEQSDRQRTLIFLADSSHILYAIGYLRNPKTNLILVSNTQIDPRIVQYYFDLFCSTSAERNSFTKRFFYCLTGQDTTASDTTISVVQKLLASPHVRQTILDHVPNRAAAVLHTIDSSPDTQTLAVQLGIPLFAADAKIALFRSPSDKRYVFRSTEAMLSYVKHQLTAEPSVEKYYMDDRLIQRWLKKEQTCFPSTQFIIQPDRRILLNSTHEQTALGVRFPVRPKLRTTVTAHAKQIAQYLAKHNVIGPLNIDFLSVKRGGRWYTYPCAITQLEDKTHAPFQLVRMLTEATRQSDGTLRTALGRKLFYSSHTALTSKDYIGLEPVTLIELIQQSGLAFDAHTGIGVILQTMSTLTQHGTFGAVCVARSRRAAEQLFLLLQRLLASHEAKSQQAIHLATTQTTVHTKRLVDHFLRYAKISSPSHDEGELRTLLRQELIHLGLKTRIDTGGNLIGTLSGEGTTPFLLCAHMDTVKPCEHVRPVVRGDTIMTDGTSVLGADDKAGIASIMEVLHLLRAAGRSHPPLEIIFSTGEETFSDGISQLDFTKIQSPYGLVVDGGNLGEIDNASAYMADVRATILGKASHSGIEPEQGISAIQIAATAIHHMKLGRIDADTTANIGVITGGSIRNAIPAQVQLHGEVRSFSKRKLEDQLERMHKALEDAAEQYGGLLNLVSRVALNGYVLSKQDPYIKLLSKTMQQLNIHPNVSPTVGATDANTLIAHGIHVLNIGTGVQRPHTVEEHIAIADMVQLTQLVYAFIQARAWEKLYA